MTNSTLAPVRWEVPEAVEPPRLETFRERLAAVSRVLGITPSGWACLVGGAVCLIAGLLLGWTELVVAGLAALFMLAVALLFTIGRPRFEVAVQVPDRSVVVGTPAQGRVLVRNTSTRRHWGSRMDLPVGQDRASLSIPSLPGGQVFAEQFRIPTARRGLVLVGPARSVQGDPFGLSGRETLWTGVQELYVHPRTISLPGRQTGFIHDLEGHVSPHLSAADMNFHALRPYAPGDDRRHVHWRSTARAGELMVRQFEESRMSRVLVALDTARQSWLDEEEFELGISVTGSLAVQTLLGESPLQLLTSRDQVASGTPNQALDGLSVVEQGTRGGIADLVAGATRRAPGVSVAFCVTGSTATLTQIRQACSRFDVDTRAVGIRVEAGAALRVQSSGTVTVVQVGTLSELPRAVRKATE